ncbi:unnamed protein product [Polarella glacialis]|uniref:Uncharacterized protein n=1 Tax=Polarella glacialis TaxID=89957 RepID=A0A813DBV3_POLGL|nr:unnamed protein product [Polarella glacialis]
MALSESESSLKLLRYLEDGYLADCPLSLAALQSILPRTQAGSFAWDVRDDEGLPLLHLAAMNEATPHAELFEVLSYLISCGADPNVEDDEGDTALQAIFAFAEDIKDDDEDAADTRQMHLAVVRALVGTPTLKLHDQDLCALVSWVRRHVLIDEDRQQVLRSLTDLVGAKEVESLWASEELLAYLQRCAYDEKCGIEAAQVRKFLDRGASPSHKQNRATALLLVVLTPYSTLSELQEVFRLMLSVDPMSAGERDGFKLSPLNWASDYSNVAMQHGLKKPNPATLLALLPAVLKYSPPEADAGEACLKVSDSGRSLAAPSSASKVPADQLRLRFLEGDRVVCRVETPGGGCEWEEGVVIGTWYSESCWPTEYPGAAYEVRLDLGLLVFALVDDDRIIRREVDKRTAPATMKSSPQDAMESLPTGHSAPSGSRFQKKQCEDGKWELLDTKSGKARPCSPPDSDDESGT